MVEGYVAGLDPAREPVGVERTVATRTDLIAVSGRIDRLDDRRPYGRTAPDELVVVDYKTGRHVLTVDDARTSLALALYALAAAAGACAARAAGSSCTTCPPAGCWPGSTPRSRWPGSWAGPRTSPQECAAADERLQGRGAAEQRRRVFPARPGRGCGWCDFRAHCPEGSAAAPAPGCPGTAWPRAR